MVHNNANMYDIRPSPPGRKAIMIGDKRMSRVKYVGSVDVVFHANTDERRTLVDVSYVPGLGYNLYSWHAVQKTNIVISDAMGGYIIGTNVTYHVTVVVYTCVQPVSPLES